MSKLISDFSNCFNVLVNRFRNHPKQIEQPCPWNQSRKRPRRVTQESLGLVGVIDESSFENFLDQAFDVITANDDDFTIIVMLVIERTRKL